MLSHRRWYILLLSQAQCCQGLLRHGRPRAVLLRCSQGSTSPGKDTRCLRLGVCRAEAPLACSQANMSNTFCHISHCAMLLRQGVCRAC